MAAARTPIGQSRIHGLRRKVPVLANLGRSEPGPRLHSPQFVRCELHPELLVQLRMPNTLFNPAPTAPFVPGSEGTGWYNGSFNYYNELTAGNSMSKRPLIVGQNPVSNFSPDRFNLTPMAGATYQFGDVRTFNGSKYVCICPNPTFRRPSRHSPRIGPIPNWAWGTLDQNADKNVRQHGHIQQLYAAYWVVMADQYTPPTPLVNPTVPGYWSPAFPTQGTTDARMFRNPIRGTGASLARRHSRLIRSWALSK